MEKTARSETCEGAQRMETTKICTSITTTMAIMIMVEETKTEISRKMRKAEKKHRFGTSVDV
jgi:hypothetical protein